MTQPHVNHHNRSITRPAKATDVRIKQRIFNDCTGNGDFEFSVDPTNLFWRDKRSACALSWTSPFHTSHEKCVTFWCSHLINWPISPRNGTKKCWVWSFQCNWICWWCEVKKMAFHQTHALSASPRISR